eukprot:scaffold11124_cov94-Isochrysis_galbana.AAC.2
MCTASAICATQDQRVLIGQRAGGTGARGVRGGGLSQTLRRGPGRCSGRCVHRVRRLRSARASEDGCRYGAAAKSLASQSGGGGQHACRRGFEARRQGRLS